MERKYSLKKEIKDFAEQLLNDFDTLDIITRGDSIDFLVLPHSFFEKELLVKDKEKRKTYNIKVSIRKIINMESIAIIYSEYDDIRKEKKELKLVVADDTIETEELKKLFEEIRQRIKNVIKRSKELKEKEQKDNNIRRIIRL